MVNKELICRVSIFEEKCSRVGSTLDEIPSDGRRREGTNMQGTIQTKMPTQVVKKVK